MRQPLLSILFLGIVTLLMMSIPQQAQAFSFFSNDSDSQKNDEQGQSSGRSGGGSSDNGDAEEDEEEDEDDDMTDDPLEDLDDEFMDGGY